MWDLKKKFLVTFLLVKRLPTKTKDNLRLRIVNWIKKSVKRCKKWAHSWFVGQLCHHKRRAKFKTSIIQFKILLRRQVAPQIAVEKQKQKIAAQHGIALLSGLWTIAITLEASSSLKNKVIKLFLTFFLLKWVCSIIFLKHTTHLPVLRALCLVKLLSVRTTMEKLAVCIY